jgi:hypothetical protein
VPLLCAHPLIDIDTDSKTDTEYKNAKSLRERNLIHGQLKLNSRAPSFASHYETRQNPSDPNLNPEQETYHTWPPQPTKNHKGPGKRKKDRLRWREYLARKFLWWIKFPPEIKHVHEDIEQPLRFCQASATFPLVATSEGILGPIRYCGYEEYFESHKDFMKYKKSLVKALVNKLDRSSSNKQDKPAPRFKSPDPHLRTNMMGCRNTHRRSAVVCQEGVPVLISRSSFSGTEKERDFVERWKELKNATIPSKKRMWSEELLGWDPQRPGWGEREEEDSESSSDE